MTARPRVLWVSHTGTWVGPTNSLSLLLDGLANRFDSTVLLTEDGPFTELLTERGIPFHSLPTLGRRAIPGMRSIIARGRFDLVYGNNTSWACANALVAARLARVPFVHHIRATFLAPNRLRDFLFRRADAHVAVSEAVADAFHRFVGGSRPTVVYNGVPLSTEALDRDQARARLLEELGLPSESILALCLAHVMSRKGQQHAVEALARAVREAPGVVLVLAGRLDREPDYVQAMETRIRSLGLEDHVRLLGFRRDVEALCRAADFQVHTAVVDPHPRAVIEGMAAGLPTVAFAVDGVGETVLEAETGYLVERGDEEGLAAGMIALASDPGLRHRLGRAARERARSHFTAEETSRRVGDVIDRVLGRAVPHPHHGAPAGSGPAGHAAG